MCKTPSPVPLLERTFSCGGGQVSSFARFFNCTSIKQKHPASPRKKFEPAPPDSQARGEGECKRRSMHLWTHLDSTRQVQSHHSLAPLVLTSSSQGGCFLACVFHQVPGLLRLVVGVWYAKDDLPGAGTQGTGLVSRYCCCSCCPSQSGGLGQPCGDFMIGSVFARL